MRLGLYLGLFLARGREREREREIGKEGLSYNSIPTKYFDNYLIREGRLAPCIGLAMLG